MPSAELSDAESDRSMTRVLVTGVTSIHGWPIYRALRDRYPRGRLFGIRPPKTSCPDDPDVRSVCMTDRETLAEINKTFRPDCVIHAAGVCDLDVCEERPDWAYEMNVVGARNVASVFGDGCRIVYCSTDLVYDGASPPDSGYSEADPPCPASVAGRTFALAEAEVLRTPDHVILRLGLPMGDSIGGDKGAVDWIESRFRRELPVTLFHDEWRSCIDCAEIAEVVTRVLDAPLHGFYHLGGPDPVSLYEIGQQVIARGSYERRLLRRMSRRDEIDGPPRIGNVHLDSSKLEAWLGRRVRRCEWYQPGR